MRREEGTSGRAAKSSLEPEEVAALEREVAAKAEEIGILRRVSSELNATLDLDQILAIALDTMADVFGFRHTLLLLLDEESSDLVVAASRGYPRSASGARVASGVGIVGVVAQRKKMMRIANLGQRRSYMSAVRREVQRSRGGAPLAPGPTLPGLPDAQSQIAIPLLIKQRLVGVLSVETRDRRVFSQRDETLVGVVANLAASAIHNARLYRRLEGTLERTSQELGVARELCAKAATRVRLEDMVGDSPVMKATRELLRKVAKSPASTILLTGENGTGKDLAARVIHDNSSRAQAPFMNITCSALAENLLESELFGHEKGAFTDARTEKRGLLELADRGTVFLDEIGEMGLKLQAKLLRFLEAKTFKRVGGARDIRVDVRVIAATNRDVARMVREGAFREDLYYRLRVLPIELPPLRTRSSDLAALAGRFIRQFRGEFGKDVRGIEPAALTRLEAHAWPGNVRELRNAVERAVLLCEAPLLSVEDFALPGGSDAAGGPSRLPPEGLDFEALERSLVLQALERCDWNKARAARLLAMPRDWLRYRMEKFGLRPPS